MGEGLQGTKLALRRKEGHERKKRWVKGRRQKKIEQRKRTEKGRRRNRGEYEYKGRRLSKERWRDKRGTGREDEGQGRKGGRGEEDEGQVRNRVWYGCSIQ